MDNTKHNEANKEETKIINNNNDDVVALPPFEHTRYSGAGVLIYSYKNDEETGVLRAYVLIGQERKGTFDDFGGGRGKGERHPILTATREFIEESIGVICDQEEMKAKIIGSNILVYDSNFYQYWIFLPELDASVPDKFLKTKTEVKGKQQLKWVLVDRIRHAILEFKQRAPTTKNKNGFNPFKQPRLCDDCVLRKLFIKKMLRSEELGLLARLEKCEL
jgi:8-oxo-dGTP pyrophosphatase MutT (NUDIX family)